MNYADIPDQDIQFYPTPPSLIEKMLSGLDLRTIQYILEPSAGKGNIIKGILDKHNMLYSWDRGKINVDCIEIDRNLQSILRQMSADEENNNIHLVWDNFLTYNPYKKYDLIIMNPPFNGGERHLLKALDIQRNGGSIICILNAETINNPCNANRQDLVRQLDKYNANIEYIKNAFSDAERKTDVEVALIKIYIEPKDEESYIYNKFERAAQYEDNTINVGSEIIIDDYIKKAVQLYNIEVKATLQFIRDYNALKPHINRSLNTEEYAYEEPILTLKLGNRDFSNINKYLEHVRYKYWKGLFSNPKFTSKLTSNLQQEYRESIEELKQYEFNEFNIEHLIVEMNASILKGVQETIISMFETLTAEHSWYPECKKNVHYYNGWKTNIAHKINYKVIIPCYGVFSSFSGGFSTHEALSTLQDIEKVLNYLDGNMTAPVDLYTAITLAQYNPKNIECKYFTVTFYKKGTCHIKFKNQALIDKFNIYVGKNKNWLPPYYGEKPYRNMTDDEKAVVDDFQGEESYNKVMANRSYYLNTSDLIRIATN